MIDLLQCQRDLIVPTDCTRAEENWKWTGSGPTHPVFGYPLELITQLRPSLGLAVPQESLDGTVYTIWAESNTYREYEDPLTRLLAWIDSDPMAFLYSMGHSSQSEELTHPLASIADTVAFNAAGPISSFTFEKPHPLPRFSLQIVDHIWMDGERTPVFDGRPLATDTEETSGSLDYTDLLTFSSGC